ncbi:MAG: AAA family ATPase [Planctomycetes bacterium]|nr:AAA family ATPase [Planctomycetota bacterium]
MKQKSIDKTFVIKVAKSTKKYSVPETRTVRLRNKRGNAKRPSFQSNRAWITAADYQKHWKKIEWLYPGVIPVGYVSFIFGPPSSYKSTLGAQIVACVTLGVPWPDESPGLETPGQIVWVETEGNQSLNQERFHKLGIPLDQIIFPQPSEGEFRLDNQKDMNTLQETIAEVRPKLVLIDSLSGGISTGSQSKTLARVFRELRQLAKRFNVAFVIIHHTRKLPASSRKRDYELNDMRGASELGQFARSVLGLDEPDSQGARGHIRIRHLKCNFAPRRPNIGMRISNGVPVFDKEPPVPPGAETMLSRAMDELPRWLEDGPKPSTWIKQNCESSGISYGIAKKAKVLLNIQKEKIGKHWFWKLPDA